MDTSRLLRSPGPGALASYAGAAVLALVATTGGAGLATEVADASSHREAPLISGDPKVDNTDVYAFVSPDKQDTVTLVANWLPFQEPNGGPNFYFFETNANHDINIDNDGDAVADVTYRWVFETIDNRDGTTFLYNNGVVNNLDDPTLLFRQTYTLTEIRGTDSRVLVEDAPVAPSNVGPASMPNYARLRDQAVVPVRGGGQSYAGQAEDPFFLDLRVFDLIYGANLSERGQDTLAGYNVQTVALQVPKSDLALNGDDERNPVVGIWSATSKQGMQMTAPKGNDRQAQVSRLGNPLVNELVPAANQKDGFNASTPADDAKNQALVDRILKPELPQVIQQIYNIPAPATPRNDLVEVFLTGIAKNAPTLDGSTPPIQADLNSQILNADVDPREFVPAEELRLNMSVPVTANPNRLGVLAGDLQGFPNGRRLADDVLDIELQVFEGAAQTGQLVPALAAGDKVNTNNVPFGRTFPYVALPSNVAVNQIDVDGMPSGGVPGGAGGTAPRPVGWIRLAGGLGAALFLGAGIFLTRRRYRADPPGPSASTN
ncbi:DUF4331 domain-containing protein [Micromonospora sp. WMMD812]|uniref:DUF4331 domain-containing protein n=1 Tax=Micromonospora sp. WMMD812 TaxID=3015152 RepID=UPI00248B7405|nr:DUF4331 domain-containing protein [Micromonospora sp. WMMD812]WBB69402.1 DUF4331 domain-containing protein [Micromonospora sp. WMMD812]